MILPLPRVHIRSFENIIIISPTSLVGRRQVASADFSLTTHPHGYYLTFSDKIRVFIFRFRTNKWGPKRPQ